MAQAWLVGTQPVEVVERAATGIPSALDWHGRRYTIRAVMQDWIAEGDWWLEDGGERHRYALVRTDRALFTLAQDLAAPDQWFVTRMAD